MKTRKRITLAFCGFLLAWTVVVTPGYAANRGDGAHARNFGLGIIVGEPTGLSAQYVLDSAHKLDFTVAYSFNNWVQLTGDYLMMKPDWVAVAVGHPSPVSAYWGLGLLLGVLTDHKNDGSIGLGIRLPFGLEWLLQKDPIGFFFELVPGMELAPSTDLIFQGAIGVRYYF